MAHRPVRAPRRTKVWLWVMGVVIVALVVALVAVLVTKGDDDSSTSTTTTTHATTTSSTSTTTTTTATTVPPTSTTVALPVITDDPQTYGEYLFAAWQNGDRTAAANVASGDAVGQMFSQAYPAHGPYSLNNCDPAAGSLYCTWNGASGATIQMQIRTLTGGLPIQVENVQFSP